MQDLDDELMPGFRAALSRLRFSAPGNRVIDWPKSIRRLARTPGYARLETRQRRRQTDYVLISDRRHLRDHSAWLMHRLAGT